MDALAINITPQFTYIQGKISPSLGNYVLTTTSAYVKEEALAKVRSLDLPITMVDEYQYSLCKVDESLITLPTGLLPRVTSLFNKLGIQYKLNNTIPPLELQAGSSKSLWDHQEELVHAAFERKRGILKSPTSSGKSFVIGEISYRTQHTNVLITCSGVPLLWQLRKEMASYLGKEESEIGQIGDKLFEPRQVTIALPMTLNSRLKKQCPKVIEYLASVRVWIADECHSVGTPSYTNISNYLVNTTYRVGLSATTEREDGFTLLIEALLGPKIASISEKRMIREGRIKEPRFEFLQSPDTYIPAGLLKQDYNHFVYNKLYNWAIVNNEGRNQLAVQVVKNHLATSDFPIVLIVRKVGTTTKNTASHADILQYLLKDKGIDFSVIHGQTPKKELKEHLDKLSQRQIPGIIAGPGIFKEGLSINTIGALVFMAAGSSSIEFIQRVGRALRLFEGKESPVIYDFLDPYPIFKGQSNKRMDIARKTYPNSPMSIRPLTT